MLCYFQQSDSVLHTHVPILFQIIFPFKLLHNIEQSSLCYTVGPCWLSVLNIAVRTCQSQTQKFLLSFGSYFTVLTHQTLVIKNPIYSL